jgi:PAS domain S-box-containing protein
VFDIRERRGDRPGKDQDRASEDSTPRREADGSSPGFAGHGRGAAALRESEELLKLITNAVPAGISYFDREQRFRFASEKYESLLGLKPSELVGKTLEEAIGNKSYEVARQYVQRVLSGQTASFENTLPAKNGGQISIAVSYVPDIGPDRTVKGFFALVQDITERKKAEEELKKSEERFRDFSELGSDWLWEMDENLRFKYMSPDIVQIGVEVEAFIGNTLEEARHDNCDSGDLDEEMQALNARKAYRLERPAISTPGKWLHISGKPLFSENGTFQGYRGATTDITERKSAEAALQKARDEFESRVEERTAELRETNEALRTEITERKHMQVRYKTLLETAPDPIVTVNQKGKIVVINAQTERVFGYGRDELIGQSVEVFLPERFQGHHVRHRNDYFGNAQVRPMGAGLELVARCKDGRELPVEVSLSPVQTTEGSFVTAVIRDISDRRKVELALRDHRESLRLLLETTNAIPWETDAKTWKFTYVGPQAVALLGYPRERWLEKDFWVDHMHPEDRAWAVDYCLNSSNQNDNYEFEYRMMAADGRSVWLHDIVNVVRQNGEPVALRGFMIDITESKQAEESLRSLSARLITAQEEERSRIARELHDDFNQRLAILAMDLERLAGQQPASGEDLSDVLATLLRRTKELSSDVHRLSHQLHPSILQHLGLVAATRSFCKEISDQNGIHIELVHHEVPRSLPGDIALCLYRIVQEALRNVIKHSGAESARVEFKGSPDELTLRISDDGMGFDPESAQTRRGLGLLSMRERLRLVNGTVSFMQTEPTGTRIDVRIPFPDSDQR